VKHNSKEKRILIIDRQEYWRQDSAQALKAAGFTVRTLDNYDYLPSMDPKGEKPDLIILGCAGIGIEEQKLVAELLENKQNLVVLCTSLSSQVMRTLFLAGANDVADKPYDPARLVNVVEQALASLSPRDSYRAVEREGKL
jgi:DNA-binding NtrC family response regulator